MAGTVFLERYRAHLYARPTLWLPMVAMVVFLSMYLPVASSFIRPTGNHSRVSLFSNVKQLAVVAPATAAAKPIPQPQCTPSSLSEPAGLDLNAAPVGLSIQADARQAYRINGNTAAALRTQIEQCAPGASATSTAEFTAVTSYNMTWQYYTTLEGDGSCKLASVKVGMHITTVMPLWQPTASATPGLPGRWQSFTNDLLSHEQGHVMLDKQYAARVLADLDALPAMRCELLSSSVKSTIHKDISALNNANDNYDASTDHGATQGAVLPTR